MVILHVLAPAEFGGLERVVQSLAAGHLRLGHQVHVAVVLSAGSDPDRHPFAAPLRALEVPVHPVVVGGRGYLHERRHVVGLCRTLQPAVVHTHGYRADVVDGGAARAAGIPVVATVHGFTGGGARNRVYERLQSLAYRRFDAVVAVSHPLGERLRREGVPGGRIRVIPNAWGGGQEPLDRDAAREALAVPAGTFHVGWVGRLSREKGADVLLEALPSLADLPLRVSFVGDGPERAALEARARTLRVGERVRWCGAVPDAARLFAGFDAFVLSSRTEGTPIVLLEAMRAGAPVVATRVGGVPDVVGEEEALLVPPEDPSALALALRRVHDHPAAALRRARAARDRLTIRFGLEPWLAAYERVYAALRPHPPGRR